MNANATCQLWHAGGDHDEFYDLPIRRGKSAAGILRATSDVSSFAVPIDGGPDLRFVAKTPAARRLRIIFHGALMLPRDRYPRYDRISTSTRSEDAFVSFADPTLVLAPGMSLGWYTGSRDWDPQGAILETVAEALSVSGAEELLFVGGSGGGYAALRASAEFPGSGAFVFSPQTSVARYRGRHFSNLLLSGYGEASPEAAYREFPGRFEVLSTYVGTITNKIYYLQNLNDGQHIVDHYNPFRRTRGLLSAEGVDPEGSVKFVLADLERQGHGAPTAAEFAEHWSRAVDFIF